MGHEITVRRDAIPRIQQHVDGQHQAQEQGDHHKYGAMLHERTYRANGYDTQPYVVYPAYFRFEFSIYFHLYSDLGRSYKNLFIDTLYWAIKILYLTRTASFRIFVFKLYNRRFKTWVQFI